MASNATEFKSNLKKYGKALESKLSHVDRCILIDSFILFLISLIPFWHTGFTGLWNKTDLDFPIYPIQNFLKNFSAWTSAFSLGYSSSILIQANLSRFALWAFLASIGLPSAAVERVYFILIEFLLGVGMYYFMGTVFQYKGPTIKRVSCMASAIFYMINPYIIFRLYYGQDEYLLTLALLPFTLAFIYRGIKTGSFKYVALTALSSIFLLSCNSSTTILYIVFCVAYILLFILSDIYRHQFKNAAKKLKFTIFIGIGVFLVNLWWIIPLLYSSFFSNQLQVGFLSSQWDLVQNWASQYAQSGLNVMRLELFLNQPAYASNTFGYWINSTFFVAIGIFIAGIVSLSLVFRSKDKQVIFFATATILSLGFICLLPPFEQIYHWMWNNIFLMRRFYVPDRFMQITVPGYAVLLGVACGEIYRRHLFKISQKRSSPHSWFQHRVPRMSAKVLAFAFLCLILVNSYPLLDGNLGGLIQPVNIPSYYNDASNWLQQQPGDFRVLLLPFQNWYESYTWWPNYDMVGITKNLFPVTVLQGWAGGGPDPQFSQDYLSYVANAIENNSSADIGSLLNSLNVKYICVRDDLLPAQNSADITTSTGPVNTTEIKLALQSQNDISLVKTFGNLTFYENNAYKDSSIYGFKNTFSTMCDFSNKSDLQFYNIFNLNIDSEDYYGSSPSISATTDAIASNSANTENVSYLQVNAQNAWNLSSADQIQFSFKISSMNFSALEFSLFDTKGNNETCQFTDLVAAANTWQQISLPLNSEMWNTSTNFDQASIKSVQFQIVNGNETTNVTFKIDGLETVTTTRLDVALTYSEVNPDKYYVDLNSNENFSLAFTQSYDSGWTATILGETAMLPHFMVTSYANGWSVNKTGNFTIVLEYKPQTYFYSAVEISVTSIIILLAIALTVEIRRRLKLNLLESKRKEKES